MKTFPVTNLVKKRGFTLIELLVSVTLFITVILISMGTLLNLSRANDRAQAVLVALNNLDFALENMARNLRTGSNYSRGALPLSAILFNNSDDEPITYYLNTENGRGRIIRVKDGFSVALTAEEIDIKSLSFYIAGTAVDDERHPKVLILVTGRTAVSGLKPEEQISFSLQTTVSQRSPDI